MPDLKAISLGTAVPYHNFDAAVHSTFIEAANIYSSKGRLLTLVTAGCADLPGGIRIETPVGFSFESVLLPGERITCRDGFLRDEVGRLEINLRTARRWNCRLPEIDMDSPTVEAAWTSVWGALDERQRRTGADVRAGELLLADIPGQSTVARTMGAHVRELVEAARMHVPLDDAIVAGLIGLGFGLTPSGDDFLVGFLTGLRCAAGKKEERLGFLFDLGKAVVRLLHQTDDISRTYLFHATRGHVSSKLTALANAVALETDRDRLIPIAEDAMRVGHSSGMETVMGFLIGISAFGKEFPSVEITSPSSGYFDLSF
jgi:hypothetical protein